MINSAELTVKLPLQLFKEIVNPFEHISASTLSDNRYIQQKEVGGESKKNSVNEAREGQSGQMQYAKGYIKYPVYEFF